jgi:hypothetical protein
MRIVALPLSMRTRLRASALGVLILVLAAACGTPGTRPSPVASASRTTSASPSLSTPPPQSPSPAPVTTAYGVLVSSLSSPTYTVSLVGIDGRVVASAQASTPGTVTCANAAAALVPPPVSTSNSRVYYMDALGVVRYLAPNGDAGRATTLAIGPARRAMFAVSPDDQRIAVIVDDFDATGASTRLYVEDLNGGHVSELFSETGAYTLWPTGWHGMSYLVLAKVPSCTQGGGPGCCAPQEFHVVDPNTAVRRYTVGDTASCILAGAPSPAGVVCQAGDVQANVLSWTGATTRSFSTQGFTLAYLSPNGNLVAIVPSGDTVIQETSRTLAGMAACAWIDDNHVLSGGSQNLQPSVGDITNGNTVSVAAPPGICAGRLPGSL